jgi:hypothetical protein
VTAAQLHAGGLLATPDAAAGEAALLPGSDPWVLAGARWHAARYGPLLRTGQVDVLVPA